MKTCTKCNQEKPLEMFSKHIATRDRLDPRCKACVNKHSKEHYRANKDRAAAISKIWRDNNPNYYKEYYAANPIKIKEIIASYHARLSLANTKISRRTLAAWSLQAKEVHPYCELCSSTVGLEAHHILPKMKYPLYALDLTNAQVLCKECHDDVHSEILTLQREEA